MIQEDSCLCMPVKKSCWVFLLISTSRAKHRITGKFTLEEIPGDHLVQPPTQRQSAKEDPCEQHKLAILMYTECLLASKFPPRHILHSWFICLWTQQCWQGNREECGGSPKTQPSTWLRATKNWSTIFPLEGIIPLEDITRHRTWLTQEYWLPRSREQKMP